MGYLSSIDMADLAPLEDGIRWQLMANHYPPPPSYMVDIAIEAVVRAREGDLDSTIELPGEAQHNRYGKHVPIHVIVEAFHLQPWLEGYLDEE